MNKKIAAVAAAGALLLSTIPALAGHSPLVARWHLNEDVTDSSDHGYDGAISGATFAKGRFGKGLDFDGVDDYVDFGDIADELENGDQMTIEAWISTTTTYTGFANWASIVSKYGVGNDFVWQLVLSGPTDGTPAYSACMDVTNAAGVRSAWEACTNNPVNDGNLHHLVGVYDGEKVLMYLDGVKQTDEGSLTGNIRSSNADVMIGYNARNFAKHFGGLVDEVRIWNCALTADEIAQHAKSNSSASPSCQGN